MGIEWEAGPLHRLAQRAADRRCDALLCKTQAMAEEIHAVEGAARERIYVVPNGVDLEAYRLEDGASAAIRETLERDAGIPREAPFAVAVGNLKPIKGHETLVRALPAALERFPALHVALVGEGESEAALRRLADDLRVTKNLHLPGRIEDVRPWMRGADLFVAPSRSEGLPNAVLEAMALGTPALLSDIPGHREAAGETAWYFEVDDVRGLSAAMIEAFGQPARRTERAREGCERIRREFSVERMVRRIESIYEALSVRGD